MSKCNNLKIRILDCCPLLCWYRARVIKVI